MSVSLEKFETLSKSGGLLVNYLLIRFINDISYFASKLTKNNPQL